jgi:hypothetical protein
MRTIAYFKGVLIYNLFKMNNFTEVMSKKTDEELIVVTRDRQKIPRIGN